MSQIDRYKINFMDTDPDSDDELYKSITEKLTRHDSLVEENVKLKEENKKLKEELKFMHASKPLSGKVNVCLLNGNFVEMEIRIGSMEKCILEAVEKFKEKNIRIDAPIEKINVVIKGVRYTKDYIILRDMVRDATESLKIHLLI